MMSKKQRYTFFVGPYPPPMHGQSFAFKTIADAYSGKKLIIRQNFVNKSKLGKTFSNVWLYFRYIYYFTWFRPSVVYYTCSRSATGGFRDTLLIILSKLRRVKIINHIHGSDFLSFLNGLPPGIKNLLFYVNRKVDCLIALSPTMKVELAKEFGQTIEVVKNFYDSSLESIDINNHISVTQSNVGYFSNLMYSKGIFTVVDTFKNLLNKYPALKLKIGGNYTDDEYMRAAEVEAKLRKDLRQFSSIEYLGNISHSKKADFLQSVNIMLLPTVYKSEALPISVIEALRAGCLVVAYNHGYLSDMANCPTLFLVDKSDVAALFTRVNSLLELENEELVKLKKDGMLYTQRNHSEESFLNQLTFCINTFQ